MNHKHFHETGTVNGFLISTIVLVVALLGTGSFAIWAYMQYDDYKTNADSKIAIATAEAKRLQAEEDEKKFAEREKEPNRTFVGPDDYGRLTFSYPKTWSAFVEKDASQGGAFTAYFYRDVVPPINRNAQYMLRVSIDQQNYDNIIQEYEARVKKGDLKSSTVSFNGNTAARFDGSFNDNIRGAAVVFKLRDKTVTLQTDADQFKTDFDQLIQTVNFNS